MYLVFIFQHLEFKTNLQKIEFHYSIKDWVFMAVYRA